MNKELTYQGKKIFYRLVGEGNPVVLIHGFGETSHVWENQIEFLKDKFQLIVPDLPGSGKSEMINDMSIEGMAEIIKGIIDEELKPPQASPKEGFADTQNQPVKDSLQKENSKLQESSKVPPPGGFRGACIIGHSMGGYITLAFAEKYPEYLNSFGLFHSTAYTDSEEKKNSRMKGIQFINRYGAFEFLKTIVPTLFSQESKNIMGDKIAAFIDSLHNFSPAALVSYYEAMMQRPDRRKVLITSKVPVLFILGEYDVAVPLKDGLELCHLPEKSYIHILHQSGHMGMIEEAGECNRILDKFLKETF